MTSFQPPPFPLPPLDLLHRTGHMGDENPQEAYVNMGRGLRELIEAVLPADWSWTGRRVLDFGCGAGPVVRHFAQEATAAEFWGCDIDGASIDWVCRHMCPPFRAFRCQEEPGLPQPDGYFDLIYTISVYTHLTDHWAGWLLEHHRVLADGGLLLATFLGEGMIEQLTGEQWREDAIGMNALLAGSPWDLGGPLTLHSPWWLRAHWGRAFEILDLRAYTTDDPPAGHGIILLRRKPVRLVAADLERLEPGEPREVSALQHHVHQLRDETVRLRAARRARAPAPSDQARRHMIEIFEADQWQMTAGERAALEGILGQVKPRLAIEIGTAEGGSLVCIAAHAEEVHSFDLVPPSAEVDARNNVKLHTGDSHRLLPEALATFEREGRNIDFVLVDGDHTSDGARRDVEDLLRSAAVANTIILLHDTANEEVRAGLEGIDPAAWPKVSAIDLDFVPGYLVKAERFHREIWGGLGLIVVDESDRGEHGMHLLSEIAYPTSEILAEHRARLVAGESVAGRPPDAPEPAEPLHARIAELERRLGAVTSSHSWRITAPLRRLGARLRS